MRRTLCGILSVLSLTILLPIAAPAGAGKKLYGAVVSPPKPAPDFELKDWMGKRLRLSSLRGKVVGLTFVFTQCPQVCPTIVARMREVADQLGERYGKEVVFLLISVDPERDTPQAVKQYEEAHGIRWPYLIGPEKALVQVWQDYGVLVEKRALDGSSSHGSHGHSYTVDHTAKLVLIDAKGLMRVQIPGYLWPPEKVWSTLEALATERR